MANCCTPEGAEALDSGAPLPETTVVRGAGAPGGHYAGDLRPIPSGSFVMGDHFDEGYPADGETPLHQVQLDEFQMAATSVTNQEFAAFVEATGYRTTAEEQGVSAVFYAAFRGRREDILSVPARVPWWLAVRGADWRHPDGPASSLAGRADHPVIHVSWDDAQAFCAWSGTRLPTEAEWEYAARGGLAGRRYAWGDELLVDGAWNCNIWQGRFPEENSAEDGYLTTAPAASYQPNGFGLHQMAGNVWEWCQDWFDPGYYARSPELNPQGADAGVRRVMRGGSYLCHDSYCNRYRVAARNSNTPDSSSGNIGFRVVR